MPANEFTAIMNINLGCKKTLEDMLKQVGNPLKVDNDFLHFAPNQNAHRTHFARLVIIPGRDEPVIYPGLEPIAAQKAENQRYRLLFSVIFDGDEASFFQEFIQYSPGLKSILALCEGYNGGDSYAFLKRHRQHPQIFYSGFLQENVQSITDKNRFRQQVQSRLDQHLPDLNAALDAVYQLQPYTNPPKTNVWLPALAGLLALIGVAIALIYFGIRALAGWNFPIAVLVAGLVIGLVYAAFLPVVLRLFSPEGIGTAGAIQDQIDEYHEQDNSYPASMLTGREDVIVQNQFNLYLTFKGNWLMRHIRLLRIFILTFALHRTVRISEYPGSLVGLTTVHFGHWIIIDGGRRLFFMTNYDGTWENYIADFVNKIHGLLDVQLACFVGFDDEGTRNITAFRRWLRRVQLQSDVFYSGYPQTTVRNISRDIEINDTFPRDRADGQAVHQWLKLLGDPTIRTPREPASSVPYHQRPALQPALSKADWQDIQSIIVYGYASLPHGRYLFLHIDDVVKARNWLKTVIPLLTTVDDWERDDPARQLDTALNIALTYPAMELLDLPEETLATFSREYREGIAPPPKGSDHLHPRSINLGDTGNSAPNFWRVGNPAHDTIHIMLIINSRTAAIADALLATAPFNHLADTTAGLRVVVAEQGTTAQTGREPFGFRDGIANPWMEGTRYNERHADGSKGAPLQLTDREIRKHEPDGQERVIKIDQDPVVRTGEFILGYPNEYGQLPATPLVAPEHDPANRLKPAVGAFHDFGRNGTYLVYRKLAQDVEGFWQYLADQARDPHELLKLAAKMVGRWPSGTPLVISPESDNEALTLKAREERNNSIYNNFGFRMEREYDDPAGMRCPFGSHIRRSHPRDGLLDDLPWESFHNANRHRIMRRSAAFGRMPDHVVEPDYFIRVGAPTSITYTDRPQHPPDLDGLGIHFLGVNANIQQQFEFIQQAWSNNNHFNGMFNSKDPLTGNHAEAMPEAQRLDMADKYAEQSVDTARLQTSTMVIPAEPARQQLSAMPRFVTVRGGAYLFIPSITALHFITEQRT